MKRRVLFAGIVLFLAAGILGFSIMQTRMRISQEPTAPQSIQGIKIDGRFSLTNHNGEKVTEKSWPEKHLLIFFGFTHCPTICPTALQKITDALGELSENAPVQPLFITTDPARDDSAQMASYIANFHHKIIGLTGSQKDIDETVSRFKVYTAKVQNPSDTDYTIDHSSFLYLIDPDGNLSALFKDSDNSSDIARVLREKTAGH